MPIVHSYAHSNDHNTDKHTQLADDYPAVAARSVRKAITTALKINETDMSVLTDNQSFTSSALFVGRTNSLATRNLLANFDVNNYGYSIKNGKIAIGATNDTMLSMAVTEFNTLIRLSTVETDGFAKYKFLPNTA